MLHLHTELQQKLQLDCKTNITQIHQKIKLHGSLTIKDLRMPHSSREVQGMETQRRGEAQRSDGWAVPHSHVVN